MLWIEIENEAKSECGIDPKWFDLARYGSWDELLRSAEGESYLMEYDRFGNAACARGAVTGIDTDIPGLALPSRESDIDELCLIERAWNDASPSEKKTFEVYIAEDGEYVDCGGYLDALEDIRKGEIAFFPNVAKPAAMGKLPYASEADSESFEEVGGGTLFVSYWG